MTVTSDARPQRRLSLVDCTSIIVGIVIGSGIYETLGLVAINTYDVGEFTLLWIVGAVFALLGSFCYAELATRYPEEGGDYVYLSKAFGEPVGFLFAWTQLWVIRPGSIGALACVFANFATKLVSLGDNSFLLYACGSVALLTLVNMLGVTQGRITQNVLTAAKILGIALLVVGACLAPQAVGRVPVADGSPDRSLALIFVLFAFSGWNEMGCVAAEVRDPRRNIWRSLLLGTAIVTAAYLGITEACRHVLGMTGMRTYDAVPVETARAVWGSMGAKAISLLICISALGSTNGMIFTGARIYYAMGRRHRLFAPLAWWSPRFGTPTFSLALQAAVTIGLVAGFSWSSAVGEERVAFKRLVIFMTPPFYLFLIGSALAVIVFRSRSPTSDDDATYRMPLFPLPPIIVAIASAFLTYSGGVYIADNFAEHGARLMWPTVWVVGTLVSGLSLSFVAMRSRDSR